MHTAMHPRFEIRLLVDTIVGECPPVTILRIAWEDKRDFLNDWMLQYYRRCGYLPRGRFEPGKTPRHGLDLGVVDFDAAGRCLERELEMRRRLRRLLPWLRRYVGAATAQRTAPWIARLPGVTGLWPGGRDRRPAGTTAG